ncbi:MAG: NADPH:quinone reductase [Chloroflexota bacterium]|nr:NADPH:quinone reductase [Chloroflexota bacterium]
MKAFALDELGAPGSIHELPDPEPGEGQVLVSVGAAAINPFDAAVVAGYMKDRIPHLFPLIPASDLAGTVTAIGPGAEGYAVGDRVFGSKGKAAIGNGALAELTAATTATLTTIPDGVSDAQAAALSLAGVSALQCVETVEAGSGDVVVVMGASGGIGGYAVQLAAARGAHVIGVTSTANVDYVRGLGAAEVVDREAGPVLDQLKAAHPDGVAAIIDTASDKEALTELATAVREGGRVISMRGAADVDALAARGITGTNAQTQLSTEKLDELKAMLVDGTLRSPDITEYPLDKAGDALAAIAGGHPRGKLVVVVGAAK